MALVAVHAVVHIPADVRVMEIGRVPAPMATRALENRVVVRIRVAGGTNAVSVAVILWEPGMVKRGSEPVRSRVTCRASCRENGWRGFMDGIGGAIVIHRVAAVASGRQRGVIVVHMAHGTGHEGRRVSVEAGQWEYGRVVIELTISPHDHVMT